MSGGADKTDKPVDWDRIGREDDGDDDEHDEHDEHDEPTPPEPEDARPTHQELRSRRIVGGVMSFMVPGTGHLAIDRSVRGILWFTAAMLLMLLIPFSFRLFALGIGLLMFGSAMDVGFAPAGRTLRPWVLIALLWFSGFYVAKQVRGQVARRWVHLSARLPSASMTPTILIGDRPVVYLRDKGTPGQVIMFSDPCNESRTLTSRLIAVGGDTVEVRCGQIFVNGEPIERTEATGVCEFDFPNMAERRFEKRSCRRFDETIGGHSYAIIEQPERAKASGLHSFPRRGADGTYVSPACEAKSKGPPAAAAIPQRTIKTLGGLSGTADECSQQAAYVVPTDHVFVMNDNRSVAAESADADKSGTRPTIADSRVWGPVPARSVLGRVTQVWWSEGDSGLLKTRWSRIGHSIR